MNDILNQAKKIAEHHPQLQIGLTQACEAFLHELTETQSAVFQSAWLGARSLGFISKDAACIAKAWDAQYLRTQHFDPKAWPVAANDFGLTYEANTPSFAPCPERLGLYAVVPDAQWVEKVVKLGVPTVQLRFKSHDVVSVSQQVQAAVKAVKGSSSLLFINDHWQQAIEAGAYGVHLGQEDMQDAPMEAIRASGLRLGLSSHGYSEMLAAHAWRPSYLALGAVFPTTLKKMETAPQGLGRLDKYVQLMHPTPLVAIGGIDLQAMLSVVKTGVGSVAVVRAITAASNTATAVQDLMQCMTKAAC